MAIFFIHLLEHMYIIKLVEPWHTKRRSTITKMKKVYFCDTGIRNILPREVIAIECKYKTMAKPVQSRSLISFSDLERISRRYIINRNLNTISKSTHFIPAVLTGRISQRFQY